MFAYCHRNGLFQEILKSPKNFLMLLLATCFHLIQQALAIYQPFLFGDFVQKIVDEPNAMAALMQMVALYAGLHFLIQLFSAVADHLADRVMTKFTLLLKKTSFGHLLGHSVARKDNGTGTLLELWSRGVSAVQSSVDHLVYSVGLPIYSLLLAFGAVFAALDPALCYVMLGGAVGYFVWLYFVQNFIRPAIRRANKIDEEVSEQAFDQLRNREIFQIFRKNYSLDQRFYDAADGQRELQLKVHLLNQVWGLGNSAIYAITLGALLVLSVYLLQQGKLNAGDMATVLALAGTMFMPIRRINRGLLKLRTNAVSAENLAEKLVEGEGDFETAVKKSTLGELDQIEVKDVTIQHGDVAVLERFNLSLKAGEKLLLRGASGSGKTSFANVLSGLKLPDQGDVVFETVDGESFGINKVHPAITYASQDENILNLSIADNIMLGEDDEAKLDWSVGIAGLSDQMLERIKSGENIGERGSNVSGGERKRIMMARALYHMNNVTIFDESLSNLDSATRDLVLDHLLNEDDLTLICISHDDALLKRFDRVVEM
ncbi:ATP-binding cassette domain-containing protein [Maritalea sp.]|uniref:ATP-binding cassette domain-containing protein n=1 Tax=Maritalea sp. TaxID=2003361 RepID=UPI003EFB1200